MAIFITRTFKSLTVAWLGTPDLDIVQTKMDLSMQEVIAGQRSLYIDYKTFLRLNDNHNKDPIIFNIMNQIGCAALLAVLTEIIQ